MDSIELIRENLMRSQDLVLKRIEDMRSHSTVPPTPFVRGQLADARRVAALERMWLEVTFAT